MLERIKLALAIVRGHRDIIEVSDEKGHWAYIVAPTYDHVSDFLREFVYLTDGEDPKVRTRSVLTWEG